MVGVRVTISKSRTQTIKSAALRGITKDRSDAVNSCTDQKLTIEMKKFQASLRPHKKAILHGSLLAIDPGSRSLGWARFEAGQLLISGAYEAPTSMPAHKRLVKIADQLSQWTCPNILAIERMFKFNPSLVWSVGMSIVVTRPQDLIEVNVRAWKKFAEEDDGYEKSDEWDAIMIGRCVIETARQLK